MKGTTFAREAREGRDARTGARVIQLTAHPSINHHLYPLACSTTPDMEWVVFASNRTGVWQCYRMRFPLGETTQMTDLPGGVHGYSGHLTPDGSELLYTARGQVRAVRVGSLRDRELAAWEGASLGEVSLSPNGEWLVTAMKWGGRNYLAVVRADGSRADLVFECERTLIHPQFHPADDMLIEYAQDPAPRMWLIRRDGSGSACLYEHGDDEFIVHETWLGDTGDLALTQWPFALKRLHAAPTCTPTHRSQLSTIADFNAWHIAPNRAGTRILCDTNHPDHGIQIVDVATGDRSTLCYPHASCRGSQWRQTRYALKEDFERAGREETALSWMEAKSDTVYGPQWTHPHPSWSADERWCIYDSDVTGSTQLYAVELDTGADKNPKPRQGE
jgi:oligogalacturonide lyase